MTTAQEAKLMRKHFRMGAFKQAAMRYYAVAEAYDNMRANRDEQEEERMAVMLRFSESEFMRAGRLAFGSPSLKKALLDDALKLAGDMLEEADKRDRE